MYRRVFPLKYAILREQKQSYLSHIKQVKAIFILKHILSSRKLEGKDTIEASNERRIEE